MLQIAQMKFSFFILYFIRFCKCNINDDTIASSEAQSEIYQVITDVNKNITLPCWPKLFPKKSASVYWEKAGERRDGEQVLADGSLFLLNLARSDTKLYLCRTSDTDLILTKIHLFVRGPPDPPLNVSVEASMLDALVTWFQPVDSLWQSEMGDVNISMTVRYHVAGSTYWQQFPSLVSSTQEHLHIHGLKPNTTYEFEVFAKNKFGASPSVFAVSRTKPDYREVELSFRLLQSSNEVNPRVWLLSLVVLLLTVNAIGTAVLVVYSRKNRLLYRRRQEDPENIELVPNIIDNPTYHTEAELQVLHADPSTKASSNIALHNRYEFV